MVTLRSTSVCCVLVLPFLIACGSDTPAGQSASPGDAPTVTSTNPSTGASDVALNVTVAATFSAPMDASTLNASTFTVKQGATQIPGTVAYSGSTATFTPTGNLSPGAACTATVSTGAKDLAGNALGAPYSWNFTSGTSTARGPAIVGLGAAGNFVVLAKTAISTVPSSGLTGNIGVSPAAATFLTGFSLVADSTNVFSNSTQVVGKVYAANYAVPTPTTLTTSIGNMESAYTDAASRPTPDFLELGSGNIGGKTLAPGLYKWTSTITIPTGVTIAGGANDVWIFQTTGDLSQTAASSVTLSGGAQAKNIFWQVAGQVTLGANSHFEGVILSKTAITLQTGATMNGRALAQTQVALQQATITQPAP
jgi:Ice-binding-like/Bacterial Ig-like domain